MRGCIPILPAAVGLSILLSGCDKSPNTRYADAMHASYPSDRAGIAPDCKLELASVFAEGKLLDRLAEQPSYPKRDRAAAVHDSTAHDSYALPEEDLRKVVAVQPYWKRPSFLVLLAINLGAITALFYYQHLQKMKTKQQALEVFSRRLMESQEAERRRIATELHDSLGQNLMVIKNQALMALQQWPGATQEHLTEISATASQAIDEVRTIAYALRPYQLDRLGLTRAAESLLKRISASSGIRFSSSLDGVDGLFSPESETSIYRILQEGVNNIVRHSRASEASLKISRNSGSVSITIADNGVGFALNSGNTGLGLVSITERVRLLGGTSQIVSAPGAGTTITIGIGCNGGNHER